MVKDIDSCFIDIKKAFDLVWHEGLWAVMKSRGVCSVKIRNLKDIYDQASSSVLVDGELGECFKMTVGITQGNPVSQNAFLIFLEMIMNGAKEMSKTVSWFKGKA